MQATLEKVTVACSEMLNADAPGLVFSYVTHELGLQAMSTLLPAYVQCSFASGNVFIPRTQIQHGAVELAE
jgi:hypothetical protein